MDMSEDIRLWVLLNQVRDLLMGERVRELRKHGLTPVQAAVLTAVRTLGDGATAAEISRMLLRESTTIYRLLDRMEKSGLISREGESENGSPQTVCNTEKGEQKRQEMRGSEILPNVFGALDTEERDQLRNCLLKMRAALVEDRANRFIVDWV